MVKKRGGRRGKAATTKQEEPPPTEELPPVSTPQPMQPSDPPTKLQEPQDKGELVPSPLKTTQSEHLPGPSKQQPFPLTTTQSEPLPGPSIQKPQVVHQQKLPPPSAGETMKVIPGTLGRKIVVETNFLPLNLGRLNQVFRYDVDVTPADKFKKLFKEVMNVFRRTYYPANHPAYDGQKLLYSAKRLPLDDDCKSGTVKTNNENGRELEFNVSVKLSGVVDLGCLKTLNFGSLLQKKNVSPKDAFQCVEIVFRQAYMNFINVGRCFYTRSNPIESRNNSLGGGLEIYLGGFQAAVQGESLFLNVDVTHKGFTKSMTLLDLICEMFTDKREACTKEDLKKSVPDFSKLNRLERFLKGLKIAYQLPNKPSSKRIYRFNEFKASAPKQTFKIEQGVTTVQTYFEQTLKVRLQYSVLPTVWVGNKDRTIYLPLEFCSLVGGQPVEGKMSEFQTSSMIKYTATPTVERKQKIQGILNKVGYNQNPCVQEFGFSIGNEFERVGGRVLDPPQLKYSSTIETPSQGIWRGSKFISGASLEKWAIITINDREDRAINSPIQEFERWIISTGNNKFGMNVAKISKPVSRIPNNFTAIRKCFEKLPKYDLIVVILPPAYTHTPTYHWVKQVSELHVGCLTQCIKSETLIRRLDHSTIDNILLKVNCKLNGTNHVLNHLPLITSQPTMIMGADVTHPGPRAENIPSVSAVTASHDLRGTHYNVSVKLQKPKRELFEIEDLSSTVCDKLRKFQSTTQKIPARLFFFRDGVSEGEFEKVKMQEIRAIKQGCDRFRPGYNPKLTFVVVQKRHHTRFFPTNRDSDDGSKNRNVPVGTCVDTKIVDTAIKMYYLLSHKSIQGTARPTKYCVLWDENDLSNDQLEQLTYFLCHLYIRCNRAVSYPAPTYYAHLAADRAKGYLHDKTIDFDKLDQGMVKVKENIALGNPMHFA